MFQMPVYLNADISDILIQYYNKRFTGNKDLFPVNLKIHHYAIPFGYMVLLIYDQQPFLFKTMKKQIDHSYFQFSLLV